MSEPLMKMVNGRPVEATEADIAQMAADAAAAGAGPVPMEVTNFQARAALRRAGLLATVHAALQAEGGEAWDAWEYANTVRRDGVLVETVAASLNIDAATLDDLFRAAAEIVA